MNSLTGLQTRDILGRAVTNDAMPLLIDHDASRALSFRTRAIQLAEQARKEDDKAQRRFLIDKARNLVNVADALDPQPLWAKNGH